MAATFWFNYSHAGLYEMDKVEKYKELIEIRENSRAQYKTDNCMYNSNSEHCSKLRAKFQDVTDAKLRHDASEKVRLNSQAVRLEAKRGISMVLLLFMAAVSIYLYILHEAAVEKQRKQQYQHQHNHEPVKKCY